MSALEDIEGRVVITHDGDTISLILDRPWTNGSRNLKIRLLGIDAPEIGQAYGSAARDTLFKRVQHRRVRVRFSQTDRYGRALADVYDGDRWINRELVAAGMAWNYSRPEDARLAAAQRTAASERRGLWSGKRPIPPWQWRQQNPRE
jgi:endonuclease YncB( thermonuclease family)